MSWLSWTEEDGVGLTGCSCRPSELNGGRKRDSNLKGSRKPRVATRMPESGQYSNYYHGGSAGLARALV